MGKAIDVYRNGAWHLTKGAGGSSKTFYRAVRKDFDGVNTIDSNGVYALYDALGAQKNLLGNDGVGNPIYEYVFGCGDYNTAGGRGILDTDIKKPVILVTSSIHGNEKAAVFSTYRFFADLAKKKILAPMLQGAIIKVVPIAVPTAFNYPFTTASDGSKLVKGARINHNMVNINRNFDYHWVEITDPASNSGKAPADQVETQIIVNWLKANTDATLWADMHNSSRFSEVAMVVGVNNHAPTTRAKRIALQGLDKVIPYWRDVIKYKTSSIYSYSSFEDVTGCGAYYATETEDIPAIAIETSSNQNDTGSNSAETIAAGAEALGNILLEMFAHIEFS